MRTFYLLLSIVIIMVSCTPMKPVLSVSDTTAFPVKGRQGLLIRQKISFSDYETSVVKRSWTRSGNTRVDLISGQVHNPAYPNLIAMDYANSDQAYYFTLRDFFGNAADVYAVSAFHSRDLQIGDNPNSVVNIMEDIFGGSGYSENLFYLQIFLNSETQPWQLVLDNHAAQLSAGDYTGFFALDKNNFYKLKPLTRVVGKKGPQEMIFGSIGYEIFDNRGTSVAAVSLVDRGEVYFHTKDPSERFLLSGLCAALLLQEDVSEAVR
ncbi:hypothetical protein [Salinimicrobium xinjiangense]|uniref:hypothetical protein n=1 Tax=Salinimicrobium xinjiangense TaxID=438596 RepID=UPI0012EBD870|nr:hypothetical protein [Salinimicrobium xinjiangense]